VRFDLHTHSTHSDGTTSPGENAALAAGAGLSGFALTDHDTLAGWDEARDACARHGLDFVPGIELSTEDDGASVHVLGYWVDPDDPDLAAENARLRVSRSDRAGQILARLAELGVVVDPAAVRAIAGTAPIGRPHIAQAMVEAGVVASLDAAFDQYLADGGPAWVVKHAVSPEDGVRLIRGAGGVAVLAHPGGHDDGAVQVGGASLELVDRLVGAGLAGLEAEHAGHAPGTVSYWRRVAADRGLVVTGSSDFHGSRKGVRLGASTTSGEAVDVLRGRRAAVGADAAERRESW